MTPEEIRFAISTTPGLRELLPDTEALAAALSVGRVRLVTTHVGEGTILSTLGAVDGATLLYTLEQLDAQADANHAYLPIRYALRVIRRGDFDLGAPETRNQIAAMAAGGIMSATVRDKLLALGSAPDPVDEFAVRCAVYNDDGSLAV